MRVVLGFLLAPLVVPLYFQSIGLLHALYEAKGNVWEVGKDGPGFFIDAGVYAYLAMIALGMPSYLFLKSKDLLTWQTLTVLGGVWGALLVSVLLPVELVQVLWLGLLPGALSGLVFWSIAVKERRKQGAFDLG